jgi:M6 family metalloprotease-like protein
MCRSSRPAGLFHKTTKRCTFSLSSLIIVVMLTLLFSPGSLWAAPFSKYFQFTQPDQTQLTLWGEGDEFHAVFETTTGYTVVFDPQSQAYFYAERSVDGKTLQSTGVLAHHPAPQGLALHLRIDPDAVAAAAKIRQKQWDEDTGSSRRWNQLKNRTLGTPLPPDMAAAPLAPPETTTVGAKVGLTLLIDFSDAPATISQSDINLFLNGDSYTGYGNNGSVKKYFSDVSGARLTYTNVVTIYIRMAQPRSYYNNTSIDNGTQGRLLINDAMAILKARSDYTSTILPTFSSLTVDGSNNVVAFNVYFAGADSGVWAKGLWPHSWILAAPIALGNGKSVSRYQITNVGTSLELGTFCHENGHMLCGFPDIYDYDYDSVGGAGVFSLMGSGGDGTNPSQVDAYLKLAAGWATVTDLDGSSNLTGTLTAAPNSGYDNFYRFKRTGVATEYFLLENRQKTGRDAAKLPGGGIAVWHVDELGDKDNQSLTPNSNHLNYELTLVQADNLWHFETTSGANANAGDANDLYYQGNSAAAYTNILDDSSTPHAHWWDGTGSGMSLNTFSASGQSMTFKTSPPPLSVTSTVPAANATGVAVNTTIRATFNRSMNSTTINTTTFTLNNGVTGTVSYDAGTKTATFTPSANLALNTSYTATITTGVTDAAGNHLPAAKVWSFSTVSPNLFTNGDFEDGASGWTQSSTGGWDLIYADGLHSHGGNGYAWLGGFDDQTDIISHELTIPANATAATISAWFNIESSDSSVNVYDTLEVTINNATTGAVLQILGTLSNLTTTGGSWVQSAQYDMIAYKGQTVRLTFTSSLDSSLPTEFFVDDVTLNITLPAMRSLTVNFPGTGRGTVTINPGSIACNTNYTGQFADGAALSLTGAALDYSDFSGWTGACTSSPCNLTMNANKTVNANFALDTVHKARIGSNNFSTLPAAYSSPAGTVIQAWGTYFAETLTCNLVKNVTIEGGYNDAYSAQNGYTLLQGPLIVGRGSLTVENLTIK